MVGSWGREVALRQAQGPGGDAVKVWGPFDRLRDRVVMLLRSGGEF